MSSSDASQQESRRAFLQAGVYLFPCGIALALGAPAATYLATPLLREGEAAWVDLGELDALVASAAPAAVRVQYTATTGYERGRKSGLVLVVADPGEPEGLVALSAVCSHKGCNVSWSPDEERFACPCHRGRFDRGGAPVAGPPTTPLARLPLRVEGGRVLVRIQEGEA